MTIRITLIDDHCMFREVLADSLSRHPDIKIVSAVGSRCEGLTSLEKEQPDVLVLDIALPDGNGIDIIRAATQIVPNLRVLILSGYAEKIFLTEALKAGAHAYVLKSAGIAELFQAIEAITQGKIYLSPEMVNISLNKQRSFSGNDTLPPSTVLGRREKEVLSLVAKGLRTGEISVHLGITPATVDVHKRNLKKKLGLSTPAELTRYAIREGLQSVSN